MTNYITIAADVLSHVFKGNTVTVHEGLIVLSRSPKANVKNLFYFCFSRSGGYEKIKARKESNSVVLSIAAYGS